MSTTEKENERKKDEVNDIVSEKGDKQKIESKRGLFLGLAANTIANMLLPSITWSLRDLFPKRRAERQKTLEEKKTALVKELHEAGIDPVAFDVLLSNEINRRLKVRFGIAFLIFTFLFTVASYLIVILDAIYKWNI